MKSTSNIIINESGILKALDNSKMQRIEDINNDAYGILLPTKLEYGYSQLVRINGLIKIDDLDFVKKTSFGKYHILGLEFENILYSAAISTKDIYNHEHYLKEPRYKKIFLHNKVLERTTNHIMEELKENPKKQLEYSLNENNWKSFRINSIEDKNALTSILLSPKDKVIALY